MLLYLGLGGIFLFCLWKVLKMRCDDLFYKKLKEFLVIVLSCVRRLLCCFFIGCGWSWDDSGDVC